MADVKKIEPVIAEFRRLADRLASRLRSPDDAAATALAANLQHQAAQIQRTLIQRRRVGGIRPLMVG